MACNQHVKNGGSPAKLLRFGTFEVHFLRKSRIIASFWELRSAFFEEVSQNYFVLSSAASIFGGSLAELLHVRSIQIR